MRASPKARKLVLIAKTANKLARNTVFWPRSSPKLMVAISLVAMPLTPTVIIANTIKCKGVSFMENEKELHSMLTNDEQMKNALSELNGQINLIKKQLQK